MTKRQRTWVVVAPVLTLLLVAPVSPQPYQAAAYGLAVLVGAASTWRFADEPEYRQRLRFLRTQDGRLKPIPYVMLTVVLVIVAVLVGSIDTTPKP